MDLSIVIPLIDEAESLPELTAWIEKVMQENNFSYEIIAVDDGSKDESWDVIKSFSQKNLLQFLVCINKSKHYLQGMLFFSFLM